MDGNVHVRVTWDKTKGKCWKYTNFSLLPFSLSKHLVPTVLIIVSFARFSLLVPILAIFNRATPLSFHQASNFSHKFWSCHRLYTCWFCCRAFGLIRVWRKIYVKWSSWELMMTHLNMVRKRLFLCVYVIVYVLFDVLVE